MARRFVTIGHSDRSIDEFIGLLRGANVHVVVDVRKLAGSRRNPQFNSDVLALSLREAGIGYQRETALAGRRPVSSDVPVEVNALWRNKSFHNYADYALSESFAEGLVRLRSEPRDSRGTGTDNDDVDVSESTLDLGAGDTAGIDANAESGDATGEIAVGKADADVGDADLVGEAVGHATTDADVTAVVPGVAVMCAEAVWWRCHRRIIADHLLAHGEEVVHVIGPGKANPAVLTPGAIVSSDHRVVYPAD